jgi:hypothetical protein
MFEMIRCSFTIHHPPPCFGSDQDATGAFEVVKPSSLLPPLLSKTTRTMFIRIQGASKCE